MVGAKRAKHIRCKEGPKASKHDRSFSTRGNPTCQGEWSDARSFSFPEIGDHALIASRKRPYAPRSYHSAGGEGSGSLWRPSFLAFSQKNSALSLCHFASDDFAENSLDESFLAPLASHAFAHGRNSRLGRFNLASCYQDCCDFCNWVVIVFTNGEPSGTPRHSNGARAERELPRFLGKEATSLPRTMKTGVSQTARWTWIYLDFERVFVLLLRRMFFFGALWPMRLSCLLTWSTISFSSRLNAPSIHTDGRSPRATRLTYEGST